MSPENVAQRLHHLPHMLFFDSSGNLPQQADSAISIIVAKPTEIILGNIHNTKDVRQLRKATRPWQHRENQHPFPTGGACGQIDYDGSFCFGIYPEMLIYEHAKKQWWQCGNLTEDMKPFDNNKGVNKNTDKTIKIGAFSSSMSQEQYETHVRSIHEYIKAGDIYQVNLTQCFSTTTSGTSLFPLYQHLRKGTPAPLASWMNLNNREVLSSSPETFLRISGNQIETRPIKGTRPRYKDTQQDLDSAQELLLSEKERAELVMITDLERNDLGQVCEFGSVTVTDLLTLEKLEHVYHLVSTVTGVLREDIDHIAALQACFPGGSITGAPKKRAMEIIAELEPVPRGLYTGAIGYLGFNNESQFSIPIRTLIHENQTLHYHVGAGIVADSDPVEEYQETIAKAKGIRLAIEQLHEHSS